jgi:hypothetical protein
MGTINGCEICILIVFVVVLSFSEKYRWQHSILFQHVLTVYEGVHVWFYKAIIIIIIQYKIINL